MRKAVLFKSPQRFKQFKNKLEENGIEVHVLDFNGHEWLSFDYHQVDMLIHYPIFNFSSNHPQALQEVYDNLTFLHATFPHLKMYPDPGLLKYYNDKYRQYLFLSHHHYPIPDTVPLFSDKSLDLAEKKLGFPMIVKNRYGAGGGQVFKVHSARELKGYFDMSRMHLFHAHAIKYFFKEMLTKRIFYYWLIKAKKSLYPFFSTPLLAQKFIKIDKDLKTVTGDNAVVEAHWRYQADSSMWKMNIDGGGTGVWEYVPDEAKSLSLKLARDLDARWLNIDLMQSDGQFLISEFSPVWHHYAYKENPGFIYRDNYNLDVPLEISLDLERIIVESLMTAAQNDKKLPS